MTASLPSILVELVAFFEDAPEDVIHPDEAVKRLGDIAAFLAHLSPSDDARLGAALNDLAATLDEPRQREVARGLPHWLDLLPIDPVPDRKEWHPGRWFGLLSTRTMISAKLVVVTSPKVVDQAVRQEDALAHNGLRARWEVPTTRQAARAAEVLRTAGTTRIGVRVRPS